MFSPSHENCIELNGGGKGLVRIKVPDADIHVCSIILHSMKNPYNSFEDLRGSLTQHNIPMGSYSVKNLTGIAERMV